MYTRVLEPSLDLFKDTNRILIAGYSGSGKTTLTGKIILKYKERFDRIISIGSTIPNYETLGVERIDDFEPLSEHYGKNILVIWDDILYIPALLKKAADCFVRGRHFGISNIFLTQNLFHPDKIYRVISLNCCAFIILKQRCMIQIARFGQTFLPKHKIQKFVDLYKKIQKEDHGYLMVDFKQESESPLSLRTYIANETFEKAFLLE